MAQVWALEQNGVGYGLLVAVKPVTKELLVGAGILGQVAHIRTCTDSSVRSSDVAKLKASIVRGEEAGI